MSEAGSVNISLFSWMACQVALFIIHYGFDKDMPWWVLWFPSLITGGVLIIVLIIALVGFIIWLIRQY